LVLAPYKAANAVWNGVSPQAVEPVMPPPTEFTLFAGVALET